MCLNHTIHIKSVTITNFFQDAWMLNIHLISFSQLIKFGANLLNSNLHKNLRPNKIVHDEKAKQIKLHLKV